MTPLATTSSVARRYLSLFVTLRGRLILLVCFATVPALLFIFYVAARERQATMERMETEARQLGGLASREHAHQLQGARDLLLRLREPLACDAAGTAAPPCPDYLPALLAGLPQFATIAVLDVHGGLLCSAVGVDHPLNIAGDPAFERALASENPEVGSYVFGPIVGRPVLRVAYAVRDAGGEPCKVAFVALDLRWLDRLAQQAKLPQDYALLITDREGRILARSGDVEAGTPGGPPTIPGLRHVLHRVEGAVLEIGERHVRRFVVATPIEDISGVFAVVGLPYERVQAEANRAFYRTMIGLLFLTLFTVTVGIAAAEVSVLRVLRGLSHTARRFGAGDLSARATLPGSQGELRDLAEAFNGMADALAARHREASAAQERLRALSQRLQVARDTEAGRIARELHDELGQVLTSVTIELTRLQRICAPDSNHDCAHAMKQSVADMIKRVEGAIEFVRRLASELRPTVLDRLGIAAALQWLASEFEAQSGLAVILDLRQVEEPCNSTVAMTLFRVAQEALTNVVRHAAATEVKIDLVGSEDALVLTVQDNGRGIDPSMTESKHSLGILGMKERAQLVGGSCTISGAVGKGTTVVVRVPRQPPDHLGNGD
ncbi:MAG: histidine kinase [Deltaproteobacteria bacterium]|nr:histidine kinase [Deltaproteobacteria bacterium]